MTASDIARRIGETITIVVLDGDEIGQELLEQAIRVLDPGLLELDLVTS